MESQEDSGKVRPLFPRKQAPLAQDPLAEELRALLRSAIPETPGQEDSSPPAPLPAAQPAQAPVDVKPALGPPPGHPHAVSCPQCECLTWKYTRECWNCRFDLWLHEQQLAQAREQRLRKFKRERLLRGTAATGVATMALLSTSNSLPAAMQPWATLLAMVLMLVSAVLLKLAGQLRS